MRHAALVCAVAVLAGAGGARLRADVAATAAWRLSSGVTTAVPIDGTIYVGGPFTQLFTPSTSQDQFYDPVSGQVRAECARSTGTRALSGVPDNLGGLLVPVAASDEFADGSGAFVPADGTTVLRIADTCLWDRQFQAGVVDPGNPFDAAIGQPARVGGVIVVTNAVVNFTTGFLQAQAASFNAVTGARVTFKNDYQTVFGGDRISELGVLGATSTRVIVRVRSGNVGSYQLGALDPGTLALTLSTSVLADESQGARSWVRGNTLYRARPAPASTLEAYDLSSLQPRSGWTAPVVPALADVEVVGGRVFLAARVVNGQTLAPPAAVLASSGAIDTSWAPPALTRRVPDPNGVPYAPVLTALATTGGRLYFSGDFERVGGADREGVAALVAQNGALDAWDTAPWLVSPIEATTTAVLMSRPTGANRVTRRYLAAIDRETGIATAWDPNDGATTLQHTPSSVSALAVDATDVYFASATNGEVLRANRTTAVVDQTWRAVVTRTDGSPGAVTTMAVANGLVYLGGEFTRISGTSFGAADRRSLAAVGVDGRLATWAPTLDGPEGGTWIRTLIADGRTIYLGGDFTAVSFVYLLGFAAVDGLSGAVTQPFMYVQGDTSIYGLATDGIQTFVAGVSFGAPLVGAASIPDSQLTAYGPTNGVVPTSAAYVAGRLYAGLEYDPESGAPTARTTRWGKVFADPRGLAHLLDDGTVEYYPAIPGNPPGPPTLSAISAGNTVRVSWTPDPNGGAPTSYTLYAGSAPGATNLAVIPMRTATTLTATVPTGFYYLTVVARNGYGASAPSNEVGVQAGCVAPPPAPGPLTFTRAGASVALRWGPAATAVSYTLEAGQSPGSVSIGALPLGNVTSFATPAPLGTYYVRVRAVNACGVGPVTNEVTIPLDGTTPLPATPTSLTATASGRTATIAWAPPASGGTPIGYQVEAGLTPGGTIGVFPTTATALVVPNAPSGTFYLRVRAVNAAGASAPTADVTLVVP